MRIPKQSTGVERFANVTALSDRGITPSQSQFPIHCRWICYYHPLAGMQCFWLCTPTGLVWALPN